MARLAVVLALVGLQASAGAQETADRVFLRGRIWTGDHDHPRAEALAVGGDRLLAVGTSDEIRRWRGPRTEVVDLKGRFVAPGFNDAHLHFLVPVTVDLAGARDLAELKRRISRYAREHPDRPWVVGRGWSYSAFPGGLPHRKQLDEVVADRPAWMTSYDGHTGWCNSKALELAGLTRDTPDPEGGRIVRDAAGEPTGALKEGAAMWLVRGLVPPLGEEEMREALKLRLEQAASYGLTSVQNASFPAREIPVFERLLAEGGLKVRVYWAVPFKKDPTAEELERWSALRARHQGPVMKFGAAKGMLDGVVESGTAAMFEPYTDGASSPLNWSEEELRATAALYDRLGWQIMLHAIGDRAIRAALDAYAFVAEANGSNGRRHRVEHVEVPRREDLPRFRELGVIASTQALFANPDPNTLEVYAKKLGPERAARAMPFRSLDEAGAVQAFGSDWPVYSMEVLKGIYCAATRTTPEGRPRGGWHPELRISPEAALRHFTLDAAYASFDERDKGALRPGLLADFVVLSQDILKPPAKRILKTKVLLTVMGGQDTFRSPKF